MLSNTLRLNFCYLTFQKVYKKQIPLFKYGYMINGSENEAEFEK